MIALASSLSALEWLTKIERRAGSPRFARYRSILVTVISARAHASQLGQEPLPIVQLPRQILLDHIVQSPLGESLLLGPHAHLQHLLERLHPRLVRDEERIVLERVLRALDVDLLELVGRVL